MKEKEYKPEYISPAPEPFVPVEGLNKELEVKGIYGRYKIVSQTVTTTGDLTIKCWFAPRLVQAVVRASEEKSDGSTDFTTTFSIRSYNNWGIFGTTDSSNLISLSVMTANADKRYFNGFNLNTSSISGSRTVYFICMS